MAKPRGSKKAPGQKKPPLTHFLCVPLVTPTSRVQLEASLSRFRDNVSLPVGSDTVPVDIEKTTLPSPNLHVINPKAIRPVGALHLTLGVMSLDKDKLVDVVEFLQSDDVLNLVGNTVKGQANSNETEVSTSASNVPASLERAITPPIIERVRGPLTVQLKGLTSMHAAHKTSILYSAPEDESGRLYPFCVALQKLFKDRGFLVDDSRELKLHATIVNTIYAKGRKRPAQRNKSQQTPAGNVHGSSSQGRQAETTVEGGSVDYNDDQSAGHGPNANAPNNIDATSILEAYKDFVWAEDVILDRVAICEMGAKKILDEGGKEVGAEYTEGSEIALRMARPYDLFEWGKEFG